MNLLAKICVCVAQIFAAKCFSLIPAKRPISQANQKIMLEEDTHSKKTKKKQGTQKEKYAQEKRDDWPQKHELWETYLTS